MSSAASDVLRCPKTGPKRIKLSKIWLQQARLGSGGGGGAACVTLVTRQTRSGGYRARAEFFGDLVRKYGDISQWDVSNVTDMRGMFGNASSFNQPLNNWNVSNVRRMRDMFTGATSFNQPLNNWNVSNVNNMGFMFGWAESFNQPLHAPWYHEDSESE